MGKLLIARYLLGGLVTAGMGGLIAAGVCSPLLAMANYLHSGVSFGLLLAGPGALMIGCIASIAAVILARLAWGYPLPSGATDIDRKLRALWLLIVMLVALRALWLTGLPALFAEMLYSLFPLLIAAGVWPLLRDRLNASRLIIPNGERRS